MSTNSDLRALLTTTMASSLSRYEEVSEEEVKEEEEEEEKEAASTRRTVWDEAAPGRGRSTRSMCVVGLDEEVLGVVEEGKGATTTPVCFWIRGELLS